jgi:hypothetical protein
MITTPKPSGEPGTGQTAVKGGSELLIFVRRAAHSHDLVRQEWLGRIRGAGGRQRGIKGVFDFARRLSIRAMRRSSKK